MEKMNEELTMSRKEWDIQEIKVGLANNEPGSFDYNFYLNKLVWSVQYLQDDLKTLQNMANKLNDRINNLEKKLNETTQD